MVDLWELPDEELWGQLDASLLEDQFRASEVGERVDALRSHMGRPLLPAEMAVAEGMTRLLIWVRESAPVLARHIMEAQAAMNVALRGLLGSLPKPPERKRRTRPHGLTQPRTLHLALQVNARPVTNHRTARRQWRKQERG